VLRIGLTGTIGSGKSEASAILREFGAHVIDADDVARRVVAPGSEILDRLVEAFGREILADDGTLDRAGLAALVFGVGDELRKLNEIVEPPLVAAILDEVEVLERKSDRGVLVVDAALLVQWDILDTFDVILVVEAPRDVRLARLASEGLSEADATARIKAQLTEEEFRRAADVVVPNSGTIEELRSRLRTFWSELQMNGR
jgi:dephospho-CoA kinase